MAWDHQPGPPHHLRGSGLIRVDRLERRLAAPKAADRQPAGRLSRVLDRGGGIRVESEGERWLWPYMACLEPSPTPQRWVTRHRRVDFLCERCRLAFEYLGEVDHAYVAQRIADDERDVDLRRADYQVRYVTKHELREPMTLLTSITATMVVRAHELGVVPPRVVRHLELPAELRTA